MRHAVLPMGGHFGYPAGVLQVEMMLRQGTAPQCVPYACADVSRESFCCGDAQAVGSVEAGAETRCCLGPDLAAGLSLSRPRYEAGGLSACPSERRLGEPALAGEAVLGFLLGSWQIPYMLLVFWSCGGRPCCLEAQLFRARALSELRGWTESGEWGGRGF